MTKKILVAEDEPDIQTLITLTLEHAGFEVKMAFDGQEALQAAREAKPDLILLDVKMPRLNGYDACRRLKAESDLKEIPVVFLSVRGTDAEVQVGMDAGATAYLLKPFSPDELKERVASILKVEIGKPAEGGEPAADKPEAAVKVESPPKPEPAILLAALKAAAQSV